MFWLSKLICNSHENRNMITGIEFDLRSFQFKWSVSITQSSVGKGRVFFIQLVQPQKSRDVFPKLPYSSLYNLSTNNIFVYITLNVFVFLFLHTLDLQTP